MQFGTDNEDNQFPTFSHFHGLTQEHANKVYHDKECLEEVSGKYHTAGKSELIT